MKIEKTLTRKPTYQTIETYCDFCQKKSSRQCSYCKKDLCSKCLVRWYCDIYGTDRGDYPEGVCPACDQTAIPFREQINELTLAYEEKCEIVIKQFMEKLK